MSTRTHPVLVEAHLAAAIEPLQIDYPRNYLGLKSVPDAKAIFISTAPQFYTEDELVVLQVAVAKYTHYRQAIVATGAVMVGDDPLLELTDHDVFDAIEQSSGLPATRFLADGSDRSLRDRALLVREFGYRGGVPILTATPVVPTRAPASSPSPE